MSLRIESLAQRVAYLLRVGRRVLVIVEVLLAPLDPVVSGILVAATHCRIEEWSRHPIERRIHREASRGFILIPREPIGVVLVGRHGVLLAAHEFPERRRAILDVLHPLLGLVPDPVDARYAGIRDRGG